MSTDRDYVQPERTAPADRGGEDDDDFRRGARRFDRRYERSQDGEHLRILSIFYYVLGALGLLFGLFPLIYVFLGALMVSGAMDGPGPNSGPPPFVGWFFIAGGGGFSLLILAQAVCTLFAGYCLSRPKNYVFCFVMACLACLHVPLGTALGVFTIVVLVRPGVRELFDRTAESRAAAAE